MVAIFKDNSSLGVFALIALAIVLHANYLIEPPVILMPENEGLMQFLLKPLSGLPPIAISILYFVLILLQALRLNYILNDLRMFQKPTLTTALAYVLLTALFPLWNHLTAAIIINAIIIWIISLIGHLYNSPKARSLIYNIGLLTGISILLYHPAIALAVTVFLALAIIRSFRPNEWFVLLLGILTPFYFLIAAFYFKNNLPAVWKYLPQFDWHLLNSDFKIPMIITIIAAGFSVLYGFLAWQNNAGRLLIQARKVWGVLLLLLLLLIPAPFLLKNAGFDCLLLAMVPVAAFYSNALFYPKNNIFPAIICWCLVGVIIYNNWLTL